ncbi:phage tail tape measure protein [Streptomyces sp. YJ-C3]
MALTVGELTGLITLDASGVTDGLRTAESQMRRAGTQMGSDAERAGQQAGQQLGDGVVRGADGRLRDLRGRFVAAGRDAGDGLGDGLNDTSGPGADNAVGGIAEKLGKLKMAAAGIGAAAGALLMTAMNDAMEQGKITGRLGAQLGLTAQEAQRYGHIAGQMYADAVTEDFQGAADAISAVMRAGIAPPEATNAQIESIATKVTDLASSFELDLGQTANAVGQMIKTGLVDNGAEAVDIMAAALPKLGQRADDVADTFNEYSTIFRQMGLDGADAMGLLSQGMQAGARDTDVVADALKEFVLITQGGGDKVDEAFRKIGLSGKEMQAAFVKGGPEARAALDKVFEGLSKMKDGTDKNNVALTLFGTKSEDTQKALMALDPSSAAESLGKVGGAADKMGDALRDNAATKVEQFKRGMQQGVVDFLGTKVIPAITGLKGLVGGAFGSMWDEAGASGAAGLDRVFAFFGLLGPKLIEKIKTLAPQAISGLMGLGESIGAWMMANPDKMFKISLIAAAIIVGLIALPLLIAGALVAAVGMILVNLGRGFVEGIPAQLGKLGSAIGGWFGGLWSRYIAGPVGGAFSSFISYVAGLPGRAVAALASLGVLLASVASVAFQRFKTGAVTKAVDFMAWVRGLPSRISGALGSLGGLLVSKGADLVRGLVRGVQSMGGYLRSQLMSFAKGMIPGPIAKALGIHSPSRVMADQIGRWIPAGIAQGVEAHSGVLDDTMSNLVNTPTPSAAMASAVGGAAAGVSGGSSSQTSTQRVELGGELGQAIVSALRKKVQTDGRGNVQLYLGRG